MNNSTLAQKTAAILRDEIINKEIYKPNDKLPNEIQLANKLGVSRTTIRETIHILVSEGILEVKRGKGTFITSEMNRFAGDNVSLGDLSDSKVTLRDLYETRMIFEPEAAALACKRASDKEIEEILRLGEICQAELKKNPMGKARIESENAFHGALIQASHNEFISHFMPVLSATIEQTIDLDYNLEVIAEDAYKDHIMIMEFLKRRDAVGLKSALTIHLHHALINENLDLD